LPWFFKKDQTDFIDLKTAAVKILIFQSTANYVFTKAAFE